MSDKPQVDSGVFFAIPGAAVLSLEGRDAVAFAQAQFMSDVAALPEGHWHWSGWLTPKGRVIALFAVLRLADESLVLVLLDADANDIASQLQRFVFRSKVVIRVRTELHASGRFSPPAHAAGAQLSEMEGALELDFGTPVQPRTLRIGDASPADAAGALAWKRYDITHGLPRLDGTQASQWTPQQLSLERLKAFSVKKGCYPGQEIVARTHFLGQAKRGLVRLSGPAISALDEIMEGLVPTTPSATVRPIGELVSSVEDEGLAVMPLDVADGPLHTAGQPLSRLPLLDGLAR